MGGVHGAVVETRRNYGAAGPQTSHAQTCTCRSQALDQMIGAGNDSRTADGVRWDSPVYDVLAGV